MKKPSKQRNKIRITQQELEHFAVEDLKVDPYWADLYNPVVKSKKIKFDE